MKPEMTYNISPEYIRTNINRGKIAGIILAVALLFFLVIALIVPESIAETVFAGVLVIAIGCLIFYNAVKWQYKVCLHDDHFEIVNWYGKQIRYVYYSEISTVKIKIVKDVAVGGSPAWRHFWVNTLCIGINITDDELEGLTERNMFMDLLRFSEFCIPMAYNEDVYQFIKARIKPWVDAQN